MISHKLYTDKIYLNAKNQCEAKYQFLISKRKVLVQSIVTIPKLLLNIQMIRMIDIEILKNMIQIKNTNVNSFYDVTADIISKKKPSN